MKRHSLFVAFLCLSSLFFAVGRVNALTIPASEDSYTAPGNKLSLATNNANSLIVDATRKSYLYFDLSDIPTDAVVRWAKLRLFLPIVQRPGAGLSVHVVNSEWNESKASTSLPTLASGTIGVITPDKMASRRFVTVDVTSTVQKWIKGGTINGGTMNEGFAVQPIVKAGSPTASVMLTSKEGPVFGLPAELDVEFGPTFDTLPLSIRSYFGPTITAQPIAPVSGSGDSLTVSASGMGLLTYQWMHNGVAVAGATGSQLPSIGLQSGTYTVVVSNGFTSVTSGSVQLSVSLSAPQGFALVTGGTLPAASPLGALPVDTFYIGKTEVTWGEWQTVRTWAVANGYTDLANVGQGMGDNYPVSHVNWYDVVKWCNARSEKEGKMPVYYAFNSLSTSSKLNFAIQGDGFFQVMLPDGSFAYTRDGAFKQNAYGLVVTSDGYPVQGFAPVPPGATDLKVTSDGIGEYTGPGLSPIQFKINLALFAESAYLQIFGENLYRETLSSGPPKIENLGFQILQGYLETNEKPVFKTGQTIPYVNPRSNGYRLPREAEWEFAARGGTQTQGYTYSGSNDLNAVGWDIANSGSTVKEVGKKQANELGIYDMSGNLSEWSGSWYPGYEGGIRVIRGGVWIYGEWWVCSVALRYGYPPPEYRVNDIGFRVALSAVP
jgi:formylglycine-generating enzyme required for sulfatase activity